MLPSSLRASLLGLFAATVMLPAASHADVMILLDQAGFPAPGPTPYGTVTITQGGTNSLNIQLVLSDALDLHNNFDSFNFNLQGAPGLNATITNVKVTTDGVTFVDPSTLAIQPTFTTQFSGTGQLDGGGQFDYGVTCTNCGPFANGVDLQGISFTVTSLGASLFAVMGSTTGDVSKDGQNNIASAAVFADDGSCTGCSTTNTGLIYGSTPQVAVPGPIAGAGLPGLIAACGGLIALARRRRQKFA
jgi:hypothetical protein